MKSPSSQPTSRCRSSRFLLLILLGSSGITQLSSGALFEKVLLSDDLFAGEKIGFLADPPELNDQGEVAFVAFMSPSSKYHLFVGEPGSLEILARQDEPAAGVPGEVYDSFESDENKLTINPSGAVLFGGQIDTPNANNDCFWFGTPGDVKLIGREDGPTPDLVGEFFGSGPFFSSVSRINAAGNTVFRAKRMGTQPSNGIWAGTPDDPKAVAMTGDMAPDLDIAYKDISGNALSQTGKVAFTASFNSGPKALFAGLPGDLHKVFRFGDPCHGIPGAVYGGGPSDGITMEYFNDDRLAYSLRISGTGITNNNDSGFWVGPPAAPKFIVQAGDPLPVALGGGKIDGVSAFNINKKGNLLILARRQGTTIYSLYWSKTVSGPENWMTVAREGAPLAGAGNDLSKLFTTLAFSLSDNGDVIFYGKIAGPGVDSTNDVALMRWVPSTRTVRRIVRKGDSIEVAPGDFRTVKDFEFSGGNGHSASLSCGVNGSGQVAFSISFSDNTKGVMIANPPAGFADWAYIVNLPADKSGPDDDANADGVSNVLVYYSGASTAERLKAADYLEWTFNGAEMTAELKHDLTVTDVTATVETANSPEGPWIPGPELNQIGSDNRMETLRSIVPNQGMRGFARVVFSIPQIARQSEFSRRSGFTPH